MENFEFRKDPVSREWVIIAPKRSKRPDGHKTESSTCPFCYGHEELTPKEVFRLGRGRANESGWEVRVVPNKFPFAPVHELIIHSPDHTESFLSYPPKQIQKIFTVFKKRYLEHEKKGQVFIFHNHGKEGAESLPHSHTQLAVIPSEVFLDIPGLGVVDNLVKQTKHFSVFCPETSRWPNEVWIAPKERGQFFGSITQDQIGDLAKTLSSLLRKLDRILKPDFPFNFYVYQGPDWYLRIIPREKVLGGFEIGTGVFVNTSEPASVAKKL